MGPILLVLAILVPIVALIALRMKDAIQFTSPAFLAVTALGVGVLGIAIALLCVAGNGSPVVMMGLLVAASILFGCGMITLAVLKKSG